MKITGTQITIGKIVNQPGSSFNGELQEKYNVILHGFVARDENGSLSLFVDPRNMDKRKFVRNDNGCLKGGYWCFPCGEYVQLDEDLFPDVKWEDDYPTEVTIRIM